MLRGHPLDLEDNLGTAISQPPVFIQARWMVVVHGVLGGIIVHAVAGAIAGMLANELQLSTFSFLRVPSPNDWKGNRPKPIHQASILDRLGWKYKKVSTHSYPLNPPVEVLPENEGLLYQGECSAIGDSCFIHDPDRPLSFTDIPVTDWSYPYIELLRTTEIKRFGDYIVSGTGNHSTGRQEEDTSVED